MSFISADAQKHDDMIQRTKKMKAPEVQKRDTVLEIHGDKRIDSYYWLNDRNDPEVIDYLNSENAFLKEVMSSTENFQHQLYGEMVGRIKKVDMSVPYLDNKYYYYTRYEEGLEYPIYCRKFDSLDAAEQIIIDANVASKGFDFYNIGHMAISPDNQLCAFSEDVLSRRIYTIRIKNLLDGTLLEEEIPSTSASIVWYNDGKSFLYLRKDSGTLRTFQVMKHTLGRPVSEDELIFEEKDETFSLGISRSRSNAVIYIHSFSTLTSEIQFCKADKSENLFQVLEPRNRDHLYKVTDDGKDFFIVSNHEATNFRVFKTPVDQFQRQHWVELIPHRSDVLIEDVHCFNGFYVVEERSRGVVNLRVITPTHDHYVAFNDDSYMTYPGANYEFDTRKLRYVYTSLTQPLSTYDFDVDHCVSTLLKMQEVVGGFDLELYASERLAVTGRDGTAIPVSIVFRKDKMQKGKTPMLLYGYGSYGYSIDPVFAAHRLSLLDRGFAFGIAHIRGGQELGRQWYEDGKLLQKKNTFNDFVDCGRALIQKGYAAPDKLYAMGGSAGGLLMGAVMNQAPELFRGVIAAVPFVDVVTTMLDESIPLTTGEFDEWGNPKNSEYYFYMKSYSPYDNVRAVSYPAILVTTGLHDSQVQYWEPAKWVAKLRELNKGKLPVLLHTNMSTGHGGASGRFERYKEIALEYAFLLELESIRE